MLRSLREPGGPLSALMSAYEQPWGLGLPTQAAPHPHIAQLAGEEIFTVARHTVRYRPFDRDR
jgi:hypothetical protein